MFIDDTKMGDKTYDVEIIHSYLLNTVEWVRFLALQTVSTSKSATLITDGAGPEPGRYSYSTLPGDDDKGPRGHSLKQA